MESNGGAVAFVCFELREPARNGRPTIRAGEKAPPESSPWVVASLTADQRRGVYILTAAAAALIAAVLYKWLT